MQRTGHVSPTEDFRMTCESVDVCIHTDTVSACILVFSLARLPGWVKERLALGHSWPPQVQTDKGGSDTWLYQVLTQQDMQPERRGKWTVKSPSMQVNMPPVHSHDSHCYIWLSFPVDNVCAQVCVCVCRQLVVLALEIVNRGGWGTVSSCEHLFLIETTKLVLRKYRG